MTLICVPIRIDAPGDVPTALGRATTAVEQGARLIEWRIDAIADEADGPDSVLSLVRDAPAPCIITARIPEEGGTFGGDGDARLAILDALEAGDVFPKYVDVEHVVWSGTPPLRSRMRTFIAASTRGGSPTTGLLLSTHDMSGRPRDLLQRVMAMQAEPLVNVVKVVWAGRSLRDNVQAFELLRERAVPMIALVMGPFGMMSRILAPKFGGLLTFAALDVGLGTAPGQPTVRELLDVYRFESIDAKTRVYGVIGWPVEHSASPAYHNAIFDREGRNAVYVPMPVPDDPLHFASTVGVLLDEPWLHMRGASVTIPHKTNARRFVEAQDSRLDDAVRRTGVANTITRDSAGVLHAHNTDADAIVEVIAEARGVAMDGARIAMLGAGGTARSAAIALIDAGACIVVFNRTRDRAVELVESLREAIGATGGERLAVGSADDLIDDLFEVYLNMTSIGMTGGPLPDDDVLDVLSDDRSTDVRSAWTSSTVAFDVVYAPRETPFLRASAAAGATIVSGWAMFERQADAQAALWRDASEARGL